jgi:hypothetical protein
MSAASAHPGPAVVVVGGGPAAIGLLVAAVRRGVATRLAEAGIVVAEAGSGLGGGALRRYVVASDTRGSVFIEAVERSHDPLLCSVRERASTAALREASEGSVPIALAARFMDDLGSAITRWIEGFPRSRVERSTVASAVGIDPDGGLWIEADVRGTPTTWRPRAVVLATGGRQAHVELLPASLRDRAGRLGGVMRSDQALTRSGLDEIRQRLGDGRATGVTIIGGSHSAFAAAAALMTRGAARAPLTILHRSPIRLCFDDVTAARAAGYADFTAADVCALTGKVFRFGGLRYAARDLYEAIASGRSDVELERLNEPPEAQLRRHVERGRLLVVACGYVPNLLPIRSPAGTLVPLAGDTGPRATNGAGEVLRADGSPVAGVLAMGLGASYTTLGGLGGEASYGRGVDGVWIYQHVIGDRVLDSLLARLDA